VTNKAVVTKKDILEVVRHLIDLKNGRRIDDIDHPATARARGGRAAREPVRIGLVRIGGAWERMSPRRSRR
jgi:DNA-directed RNA polymerase subunit beta